IENEERMRRILDLVLRAEGYRLILADSAETGIKYIDDGGIDLVLTDLQMGRTGGFEVLDHVAKVGPEIPVIIITGFGTVRSAVESMKKGAFDYISKPVDNDELKIVVKRALAMRRLQEENRGLSRELREQFGFENIVGQSPELQKIKALARDIAATESTVLISGESGTGKELLARAIHYASGRRGGRWWRSTAQRSRRIYLNLNCSVMKKAPSPMPKRQSREGFFSPTEVRCFSTRSVK